MIHICTLQETRALNATEQAQHKIDLITQAASQAVDILSKLPLRTNFERENFLFNTVEGPRLIQVLCDEVVALQEQYLSESKEWQRTRIVNEINIINSKIASLIEQYGTDVAAAIESADSDFWTETYARRGAVEAITQQLTNANMQSMLNLPMPLYETAITKCQTYINAITKTTRAAERKANLASVTKADDENA